MLCWRNLTTLLRSDDNMFSQLRMTHAMWIRENTPIQLCVIGTGLSNYFLMQLPWYNSSVSSGELIPATISKRSPPMVPTSATCDSCIARGKYLTQNQWRAHTHLETWLACVQIDGTPKCLSTQACDLWVVALCNWLGRSRQDTPKSFARQFKKENLGDDGCIAHQHRATELLAY